MKPTLKMIAEYAGVSRGTVDRVLHGRPKVKADKRRRVEEALKKFKYTPNAAARSLALKTRNVTIAVLLPPWTPYYRREISRGVNAAKEGLKDYSLNVIEGYYDSDSPEDVVKGIDTVMEQGVNALAICAANTPLVRKRLLDLTRSGLPVVTFNSDVPGCGQLGYVGPDDYRNGRIAAELLGKLLPGDAKIFMVCSFREFESIRSRIDGFRAKAAELGLAFRDFPILETFERYEVTHKRVLELLRSDPGYTGVYVLSDSVSGAVDAVRDAGATGRVRMVCHDLRDTTVKALREGAVDFTVDQNVYSQGVRPVSIIADFLLSGKRPEQQEEYIPSTIVCAETIR